MSTNLMLISGLFSIFIILFIIYLIRKGKISVKYSLIWIILFTLLFLCLVIPGLLSFITELLGFKTASNMVISILIGVLVVININNTIINTSQDNKIRLLIQEISLLKKEKDNLNNKSNNKKER